MARLGIPMQGSKNKIADWVIEHIPSARHFFDLFAGGGAVAHAALLSGKYGHVHANDITDSVMLFQDALNGDLDKYEPDRFRTREDFFAEKDTNPFVRIVYSFGNDQSSYLYSRNIEPYKKAVHEMLYASTPNERRLKYKTVIREIAKLGLIRLKSGDRTYDCESIERQGRISEVTTCKSENYPPPQKCLINIAHMENAVGIASASMSDFKARNAQNEKN